MNGELLNPDEETQRLVREVMRLNADYYYDRKSAEEYLTALQQVLMEGPSSWTMDVLNKIFHFLHPACPAYPGIENPCDSIICDCGQGDNSGPSLDVQVKEIVEDHASKIRFLIKHFCPEGYFTFPDGDTWEVQ